MKGRNSGNPREMNIDHLSRLSPPFFTGGGLARPRQLLEYDSKNSSSVSRTTMGNRRHDYEKSK
jgi:hypothetical protein